MKKLLIIILIEFINCSWLNAQSYEWQPLPEGIYGSPLGTTRVESMLAIADSNLLYVAGDFDSAGALPCSGLAIWSGHNFQLYPSISGGSWIDIVEYNNQIAGATVQTHGVYLLDGLSFNSIGHANSDIHSLLEYKGDLYAGGDFTNMDGVLCNGIARWDGTSWHPCGTGVTESNGASVDAMGVYNNKLYVGGDFEFAGGIPAWNLATWDSTNWQSIGIGTSSNGSLTSGYVKEMGTFNNKLFISGHFNEINGVHTSPLAYTDGVNWFPTNGDFLGFIYDIKEFNNKLYICSTPNQVYSSSDGINYTITGSLFTGNVICLEEFNDTLYVGGQFFMCGDTACYRIARLVEIPDDTTGISNQIAVGGIEFAVFPNPAKDNVTVSSKQFLSSITITDLLGREMIITKPTNTKTEIDVTALSAGVYLLMVESKNGSVGVSKFLKE